MEKNIFSSAERGFQCFSIAFHYTTEREIFFWSPQSASRGNKIVLRWVKARNKFLRVHVYWPSYIGRKRRVRTCMKMLCQKLVFEKNFFSSHQHQQKEKKKSLKYTFTTVLSLSHTLSLSLVYFIRLSIGQQAERKRILRSIFFGRNFDWGKISTHESTGRLIPTLLHKLLKI